MISKLRGSDGIFMRSSNIDICVRVCIDIRFRFVAGSSEAESQGCYFYEMVKCLDYIVDVAVESENLSLSTEERDRWCQ